MKRSEARKIVSSYLAGESIPGEALEDACASINRGDRGYLRFLEHELGLTDERGDACEAFTGRAAEFCEMSDKERRRELPELAGHLEGCEYCRALYREIYSATFASPLGRESKKLRRLREPIRLTVDWRGRISQTGLGPAEFRRSYTLAGVRLAGPSKDSEQNRKKWIICLNEEDDLQLSVSVSDSGAGGNFRITFELKGEGSETSAAGGVKLEAYKIEGPDRILRMTDSFEARKIQPLMFDAGVWSIRLLSGGLIWEIPLILECNY